MTASSRTATTHALYRFFDAAGELLYIGITNDPGRRWGKHAQDKPWWQEVDHIEIERYPSRKEVLEAEKAAIKDELPRYNIVHAVQPLVLPPISGGTGTRPFACQGPQCGAAGSLIFVLYADLIDFQDAEREWERARGDSESSIDLTHLIAGCRQPPNWHAACDQHLPRDAEAYGISMPTTWQEWLWRTAVLMGSKHWLADTDWSDLLQQVKAVEMATL